MSKHSKAFPFCSCACLALAYASGKEGLCGDGCSIVCFMCVSTCACLPCFVMLMPPSAVQFDLYTLGVRRITKLMVQIVSRFLSHGSDHFRFNNNNNKDKKSNVTLNKIF